MRVQIPSVNCACKKCRNSSRSHCRLTHEEGLVLGWKPPQHLSLYNDGQKLPKN